MVAKCTVEWWLNVVALANIATRRDVSVLECF